MQSQSRGNEDSEIEGGIGNNTLHRGETERQNHHTN